MYVESCIV